MKYKSQIIWWMILFLMMVCVAPIWALYSPREWYNTREFLDDKNGNRLEDVLDRMIAEDPSQMVDVMICFLNDCRPDELIMQIEQFVQITGGQVGYQSTVVASVVVRGVMANQLTCLVGMNPEIGYVHLDHIVEPQMTTSGQALKAHKSSTYSPNTAEDQGYSGNGITIAILDTGVDDPGGAGTTHSHLPTAVGAPGVAGLYIDGSNNLAYGNPDDQQGHGTCVAGCALGRGDAAGNNRGIAPKASLFDCRITPPGTSGSTTESNIQQAVDWLTWNGSTVSPAVRVANLSFGSYCESSGTALTASLEALVASGVVVCVSAGNNDTCVGKPTGCGGANNGMGSIAVTSRAITVAAATHMGTVSRGDDAIANYSRTGPGTGMNSKPDITAYGNQCVRACPTGCVFGTSSYDIRAPLKDSTSSYTNFGGTSAASPMVAGGAALIIERNTAITPAAVKKLLMDTAEDKGTVGWDTTWGAGLMDLGAIFKAPPANCDLAVTSVTYSPSTVQCYQPVTITVTVKNVGPVAVSDFAVDWERWYFGPSGPAQRLPIGSGPTANTAGPLAVNATRTFSRTWTPGVSDSLPISKHSCFWGIVSAACDTNKGNNERNRNVDIIGVKASYSCSPPAPMNYEGYIEFPFRVDHDGFGQKPILIMLENRDPELWQVELLFEQAERVGDFEWMVFPDNQRCPTWGTLRIESPLLPREPGQPLEPIQSPPFRVEAYDLENDRQLGYMEIVVDLQDRDGDGIPDVDDNCPDMPNIEQEDFDEDRVGDICDNCPELFNPDQRDLNQNGIGDACDPACRLVADLDDDCDVDLGDLAIMSGEWLEGVFLAVDF